MENDYGAFMPGKRLTVEGGITGPLLGKVFAAKDVFDIAGHPTSNGQPLWSETHPLPTKHAIAISRLLEAGAVFSGKTICDEMCYSLAGDNVHYGAPINPAAPDRSVGGSSSGSASAVAGKLTDFALGTDCGGSVRCPASFSAIYGIRPTHGRIDDTGVAPLAVSFDVVGWFARDPSLLETIGKVLLEGPSNKIAPTAAIFASDAFARLSSLEREVSEVAAANLIEGLCLETKQLEIATEGLDRWSAAFRHLQALEIWANHAKWVTKNDPQFGPGVRERFEYASRLNRDEEREHQPVRDAAREIMAKLFDDGRALIVMPTAPVSPKRTASAAEVEDFRSRVMGLTSAAGLTGCPQITLPLATEAGPIGISILGPQGSDESLLKLVAQLSR